MTIQQTVNFNATPEKLYRTLTTSKDFAEFTGAPAEIDATEGGEFSCFGGQVTGKNVQLDSNQKIVQEWRAGPWPEGVHSTVTFSISASDDGAVLELHQSDYPDGADEHLEGGWHKMYWEPLKSYFG